jgi:hypothetical protein
MVTVTWKNMSTRARRIYVNTVVKYEFGGNLELARHYGDETWSAEFEGVFQSGETIGGAIMFKNHGVELDEFAASFLEIAIENEDHVDDEFSDEDDFTHLNMHDVTKESLEEVKQYCGEFLERHRALIELAAKHDDYSIARAGCDLFCEQARLGVGFRDRGLDSRLGKALSNAVDMCDALELEWWNPSDGVIRMDDPPVDNYPREGVQITFRRNEPFGKREQRLRREAA